MLLTLWMKAKGYSIAIGAAASAILGIFFLGSRYAKKEMKIEQLEADAQARENKDAITEEIRKMDDNTLLDEFDSLYNKRRR